MNAEELKTHIDAALEPLLHRISALEAENAEIKNTLKTLQQGKPGAKPAPVTNPPNTNSYLHLTQM